MKRIIAAATVLCALTLAGQDALAKAKTLEEVLKEKGVITEEDYRAVTQNRPVSYKLGEGFTFVSPDQRFKGAMGSQLQLRYTFVDKDLEANPGAINQSEFRLRRIKLYFNGYAFSPDLTYKLVMNFAEQPSNLANGSKMLEETYMNYRFLDEAQLRFGQDKVPFARQELTSTALLQFVDRSIVTDAFKPSYDTGLKLHGKVVGGLVNYDLGVYGGVGQGNFRSTNNNSLGARLAFNPLGELKYSESDVEQSENPLFSVAASYFMDTVQATKGVFNETNNLPFAGSTGWFTRGISNGLAGSNPFSAVAAKENIDFNTFQVDMAGKWRGASFQAEYFLAKADGKNSDKTLRGHGFYAQAGYFLIPRHLELAARYSWLDPNRDATVSHQITEVQGAVSYYFNQHNLKIQGDVTDNHDQTRNRADDMTYRLQAQLLF